MFLLKTYSLLIIVSFFCLIQYAGAFNSTPKCIELDSTSNQHLTGYFDEDNTLDTVYIIKEDSATGLNFVFDSKNITIGTSKSIEIFEVFDEELPTKKQYISSLPINHWEKVTSSQIDDERLQETSFIPSTTKMIQLSIDDLSLYVSHDIIVLDFGDIFGFLAYIKGDMYLIYLGA